MQNEHQTLHENAIQKSKSFKQAQSELLAALDLVDQKRVYLAGGASSLFDYTTRFLGLSEDIAMTFIRVMRKCREIPALREAVEKGELPLSKARRIVPILKLENQGHWLEVAKKATLRELDQKIASQFPQTIKRESVRVISEEFISVTLRVRKCDFEKIKRAQDLRSKNLRASVSLEATLVMAAEEFLKRHDPIQRTERVNQSRSNAPSVEKMTETLKSPVARRYADAKKMIPSLVLHQVNLRDRGRCQYRYPDGSQCKNSRYTEVHHKRPRSQGGAHTTENLITLCSGHHRGVHGSILPALKSSLLSQTTSK